jgi:hypothetical protein
MLQFDLDGRLDLSHLSLHKNGVPVAFSMVLDQKFESVIISVFGNKPSGTFWDETMQIKSVYVSGMECDGYVDFVHLGDFSIERRCIDLSSEGLSTC